MDSQRAADRVRLRNGSDSRSNTLMARNTGGGAAQRCGSPAFSYLYYFAPYINPSGNNACTFNIKRGKTKLEVIIRPTIRSEVTVEIK